MKSEIKYLKNIKKILSALFLRIHNYLNLCFFNNRFFSSSFSPDLKSVDGFTLIELLISIAIIGVLTSAFLMNLSGFRERTRDTTRKKDLMTIQTALELYRADASQYPNSLPACNAGLQLSGVTYLKQVPCDPDTNTRYNYQTNGTPPSTYTMFACLENANDKEKDNPKKAGCSRASFTVLSP